MPVEAAAASLRPPSATVKSFLAVTDLLHHGVAPRALLVLATDGVPDVHPPLHSWSHDGVSTAPVQ